MSLTPSLTDCLNGLQALANLGSSSLVTITKTLNDVAGSTAVDAWMDSVAGIGHRVVHGHSLDHLPAIFEKFGWSGVTDYLAHGLRDTMSPHGMPIPFAKEIGGILGLAPLKAVRLLSLNIGDLMSIGFSIPHTYQLYGTLNHMIAANYLPPAFALSTWVGSTIKLVVGLVNMNPMTSTLGLIDLGLLAWALTPGIGNPEYFQEPISQSDLLVAAPTALAVFGLAFRFRHRIWSVVSGWKGEDLTEMETFFPNFLCLDKDL